MSPTLDPIRLPTREMLVIGGTVLAISIAAFLRVPLLPAIGHDLDLTVGQLGLITTVFAIGRLATDIPAGRLADRKSAMWALALAGAFLAVGSLGFAIAPSGRWVLAAAFLLGIASAVANTTGMTFFSTAAPAPQRGRAMAGFSVSLLGGQALGPMVGGLIGEGLGWRAAVGSAALVGLVIAVVAAATQRRRMSSPGAPLIRELNNGADIGKGRGPDGIQRAILYSVAFASFFMLGSMPQTLVPIIGDQRYGLTAGAIGVALGIGGLSRMIGALAGGRLADRVSRKASLVPGLLLCSVGVAVFAFDVGLIGWGVGIVLLSLGSYGISVAATMLADHAGGAAVGRRLGAYRFVGDIGLISGPAISALLYERFGAASAVLTVAGLLAVVAIMSGTILHETRWLDAPSLLAPSPTAPGGDPADGGR